MDSNIEYLNLKADIADKVAAGLRRMNVIPDALLFFDSEAFYYDRNRFLDIPVIRTSFIYQGNGQPELIFYPVFFSAHRNMDIDIEVINYRRGYEEQ